jgi:subtilisin-like proprotein convertase family protein
MMYTAATTKAPRVGGAAAQKARIALVAALVAVGLVVPVMVAGLLAPPAQAATLSSSNSTQIKIADSLFPDPGLADAYPSHVNVQNLGGNVTDANLKLSGYTHTFPDDVGVLLVGPQGQKALLMSDVGGDHTGTISDVNLTLDDEATNPLPDNSQINSGSYEPTRGTITSTGGDCAAPANFPSPGPAGPYAPNLSAFDGTDPNGIWDLYLIDDCQGDEGQFTGGWSLDITTDAPDPTPQPDTTSPRVVGTNPLPGATGISPSANVRATFSEGMQAPTINGTTVELFKKGTTTKVGATVRYDSAAHRATLDPKSPLKRGATYKAVVTTGAKDLAGNRLDQNPNKVGNQPKAWSFTVKP